MKNLNALAMIGLLTAIPIASYAQSATPVPATAATDQSANASAPTPNPDTLTPELGDGIIACRLAVNDGKHTAKDAISTCLDASKHYSELAQQAFIDNKNQPNDAACKYGVNAAITVDVAEYVYNENTKTHAASAGFLEYSTNATALVKQNGCDQKYVDQANKAFADTHPPATKDS